MKKNLRINNKVFRVGGKFLRITEPLWTPSLITTVGWWDASDESTITTLNGSVSQLDDKSGNARHMGQGSLTEQPYTGTRTINGLNSIEFDETNWLEHTNEASEIFPVDEDINVFIIASRDESGSDGEGTTGNPAYNDIIFYVKDGPAGVVADTTVYDGLGSTGDVLEAASMFYTYFNASQLARNICYQTFQDSAPGLWTINPFLPPSTVYQFAAAGEVPIFITQFSRSGDGMSVWANSIQSEITSFPFTIKDHVASTIVLGGHGSLGSSTRRLDGVIGEVVVTHGTLTDDIRYKMEGYLAWKWGQVDNLPVDHPYKLAAPTV